MAQKNWHPWGKTIGFHDEAYVEINDRLFLLKRFWDGDQIKFYVPQGFWRKAATATSHASGSSSWTKPWRS